MTQCCADGNQSLRNNMVLQKKQLFTVSVCVLGGGRVDDKASVHYVRQFDVSN